MGNENVLWGKRVFFCGNCLGIYEIWILHKYMWRHKNKAKNISLRNITIFSVLHYIQCYVSLIIIHIFRGLWFRRNETFTTQYIWMETVNFFNFFCCCVFHSHFLSNSNKPFYFLSHKKEPSPLVSIFIYVLIYKIRKWIFPHTNNISHFK